MTKLAWTVGFMLVTPIAASLAFIPVIGASGDNSWIDRIDPSSWRSGDIVFFEGKSLRSRLVRLISAYETEFSHVGVLVIEAGEAFVVHADPTAAGGEVVKEQLAAVITRTEALGGAVYRLRNGDPTVADGVVSAVVKFANDHVPFDHEFDLRTEEALYCTELVWRSFLLSGVDILHRQDNSMWYILPIDLISPGRLEEVDQF